MGIFPRQVASDACNRLPMAVSTASRVCRPRGAGAAHKKKRFGPHTGPSAAHMMGSGSFFRPRESVPATVSEAVGGWWRRHGPSCWHRGTLPGTAPADWAMPGADALRAGACSARAPRGCGRSCQVPASAGPRAACRASPGDTDRDPARGPSPARVYS